jgi:hypothetical protein
MIRNPKQEGSNLFDCIPQVGPCPNNCNQCFYNRPGVFYVDINKPSIPTPDEVGNGIIRMNCGHDSNIQRDLVISAAAQYKYSFFNTSIPKFDFPGPVVLTANPKEEISSYFIPKIQIIPNNLMFVRLRVSASNLELIEIAVRLWTAKQIPVVLTFMSYYENEALSHVMSRIDWKTLHEFNTAEIEHYYVWKVRHINSYYCPTKEFIVYVLNRMKKVGGRLVTVCGSLESNYCKDCRNCETYYWQTIKHMKEIGD